MPRKMSLDHVSLLVRNLDASEAFYTGVLGFTPIRNGTTQPHIRWYGIGEIAALHITQGEFGKTYLEKPTHFAVHVEDFDGVVADLRARKIPFWDWPGQPDNVTGRPDGFRQIYLRDPDGYWIEVNDHTRNAP